MPDEFETTVIDELSDEKRALKFEDIRIFRQAGGCIDITQVDHYPNDGTDIVHVCSDQIDKFIIALRAVFERVPPRY